MLTYAICLPSGDQCGKAARAGAVSPDSLTRYRFTAAERELIAKGADLILGQPHHRAMMPISLELALAGEYPKEGQ